MKQALVFCPLVLCLATAMMQETDPRIALQHGIDLMENRGDCEAATKVFSGLANAGNRGVQARALLYLGECHQKLGKDPKPFYRRLVREFQDQPAVASQAARSLQALMEAEQASRASPEVRQGSQTPVIINRIRAGIEPWEAVTVLRGRQVWVTNLGDPSVSVIDTSSNQVVETIPVSSIPSRNIVSGDGERVFLAFEKGGVEMIGVTSRRRAVFETGVEVIDLAVSNDGKALYLAMGRAGVSRLDSETGRIQSILETPWAQALTLSPDGRHLWVNYQSGGPGGRPGHDAIAEFDTETGRLLRSITDLPNVGGWIQFSPDGRSLLASAGDACSHPIYDHEGCDQVGVSIVNVLDSNTYRKVGTVAFSGGAGPRWPFRYLPGRDLTLAQMGSALSLFQLPAYSLVGSIPFRGSGSIAFAPDGATAYAPIPSEDVVAVLWFGKP